MKSISTKEKIIQVLEKLTLNKKDRIHTSDIYKEVNITSQRFSQIMIKDPETAIYIKEQIKIHSYNLLKNCISKEYSIHSKEYTSEKDKINIKCNVIEHSIYSRTPKKIRDGDYICRECSPAPKIGIKLEGLLLAKTIANEYGGECLETVYKNQTTKMKFKCKNGHEFHSLLRNINHNNSWCPQCSMKNKDKVRIILEEFFNSKLKSSKPSWNKNPLTNTALTLDGYCKKLNIAFEYDGQIKIKNKTRFKTEDGYINKQNIDKIKTDNCSQNKITLIRIQAISNHTETINTLINHVLEHLKEQLKKHIYYSNNSFAFSPIQIEDIKNRINNSNINK